MRGIPKSMRNIGSCLTLRAGQGGKKIDIIADIVCGDPPAKDHHRFSTRLGFLFVWHSHLAPSFFSAFSEGGSGDDKEIGRLTHSLSYSSLVIPPWPAAAIHPFYAVIGIKKRFCKLFPRSYQIFVSRALFYIGRTFSKPPLQANVSLLV